MTTNDRFLQSLRDQGVAPEVIDLATRKQANLSQMDDEAGQRARRRQARQEAWKVEAPPDAAESAAIRACETPEQLDALIAEGRRNRWAQRARDATPGVGS